MASNSISFARPAALLLALAVAGCASLPADWGRADVAAATALHGRPLPGGDTASLSRQLLAQPLTADNAITLALIHNPAVRETTARLGFAAADVYDAARISNPVFSFSRLSANDPAAVSAQIGLGIAFSFTDLLLLPARSRLAESRFEAVKLEVGAAAMGLASEVETAWYRNAGADQTATMRAKIAEAAEASATLSQRYFDAGNISKRELAMEKAAAAQAQLELLSAQADAQAAHSSLNRLMGLPATQTAWTIAGGLPAPLQDEDALDDLLKLAADCRLDVAAARKNADAIASAYGLARRTRFLGSIDVGYMHEKETDGFHIQGPSLSWAIPIFNWGSGRVARAQAELDQAEAQLAARELDASNAVQAAHAALLLAKALAERYRTGLIPQREAVVEQAGREVNFMLIGAFDLILVKQQQYDAYAGYLKAVRDYWVARAELTRAVGRKLPSSDQTSMKVLDAQQLATPKDAGGMGHMGHDMSGMKAMEGMDMQGMQAEEGQVPPAESSHKARARRSGHRAAKPASSKKMPSDSPGMNHSKHGMSGMDMKDREMPVKQAPAEGPPGQKP